MSLRNKILIAMAILSGIVLLFGIVSGVSLYQELTHSVSDSEAIYVDGSDFTPIVGLFSVIGGIAIAAIPITVSLVIIFVQWIIYGVIWLVKYRHK